MSGEGTGRPSEDQISATFGKETFTKGAAKDVASGIGESATTAGEAISKAAVEGLGDQTEAAGRDEAKAAEYGAAINAPLGDETASYEVAGYDAKEKLHQHRIKQTRERPGASPADQRMQPLSTDFLKGIGPDTQPRTPDETKQE